MESGSSLIRRYGEAMNQKALTSSEYSDEDSLTIEASEFEKPDLVLVIELQTPDMFGDLEPVHVDGSVNPRQ
jgi:hypothetical protein